MKKLDFSKPPERYLEITFPENEIIKIYPKILNLNNVDDSIKEQDELNRRNKLTKDDKDYEKDNISLKDYWLGTFNVVAENPTDELIKKISALDIDSLIEISNELTDLQTKKPNSQKKNQSKKSTR